MSCYATLKDKGLRLTQPRRVILDYIHDKGDHLTAEEIITYVHGKFPRINKSTIYRTLELLEKNECVYKIDSPDRPIYYHAEAGHHHHLVCSKCGQTLDCDEDLFAPIKNSLEKKYGFKLDFKHVIVSGLCKKCSKEN
jgi:Fur family transcriptional regulator, ferric uptake regulator